MKLREGVLAVTGGGIITFVVAVFGFGLFDLPFSGLTFYSVQLVPQGASGGALLVTNGNKCKHGEHDGCLLFEEDEIGFIKFYLAGSRNKIKRCSDDTGEVKAVITKIELTASSDGDDPEAVKGEFTGNLPDWVKQDAFPDVDQVSGIVYEADWDKASTQAWLVNLNSHKAADGVFPFWYKVTASDCDEDSETTWVTDPRGDNEGIN